jgi:putative ABC transport system permease protein
VAQRTKEIGLRMALGAAARDVLELTVWQGLKPVFLGLLLGVPAAIAATRVMQNMLFEIESTDPLAFAGASLALVAAALAATAIPARRAARVEPMAALRQ